MVVSVRKEKRVTREEWLAHALEMFASNGAAGLRVENLAKALDISKSGFYCHFKNKGDLLDHILGYWSREYTEIITGDQELLSLPAYDRLLAGMNKIFDLNLAEYDAAMDIWSRSDARVARTRKKVMAVRVKFFRDALEELGFAEDELEMRARVFAVYQMAERQIFGAEKQDSERYSELRLRMLTLK